MFLDRVTAISKNRKNIILVLGALIIISLLFNFSSYSAENSFSSISSDSFLESSVAAQESEGIETSSSYSGSSLKAFYRFDSGFSDSSGNGQRMQYSSGGLYFDGADDYVEAGSLSDDLGDTFTLTQWVRPRPGNRYFINSAHDWIDSDGDGDNDVRGYWLELRGTEGQLNFVIGNGSKTVSLSGDGGWKYNEWSHVAASVSSGKMNLYVNGSKVAEQNIDLDFIQRDTPTYLSSHHAGNLPLNGSLSDIRVYNSALNSSQVSEVYRGEFENKNDLVARWLLEKNNRQIPDLAANNTGVWHSQSTEKVYAFENVSGNTVSDLSSNSNDGSLQNIVTASLGSVNRTKGRLGSGLDFDGSEALDIGVVNFTNEPHSVSTWVKTTDSGSQIVGQDANHINWEFQLDGGSVHFWMEDSSDADYNIIGSKTVNDGRWHHLAASYEPSTDEMRLFIDGELQGTTTFSNPQSPNVPTELANGDGGRLDGKIDEFKIYDGILSDKAVEGLYQKGLRGLDYNEDLGNSQVLDIGFELGNDSYVYDSSVTGGHGLVVNASSEPASECVVGRCYSFGGGNEYIALEKPVFDSSGMEEVTVMSWFKGTGTSEKIINSWDRSEFWRVGVHEKPQFHIRTDNGTLDFVGNTPVNDNEWHHLAFKYDDGVASIYVDGKLDAQTTYGSTFGRSITRYGFIGDGSEASTFDGDRCCGEMDGKIDELKVFTEALSREEIVARSQLNKQKDFSRYLSDDDVSPMIDLSFEGSGSNVYSSANLVEGISGTGYDFDGVDDGISTSSFTLDRDAATLSWWSKFDNASRRDGVFVNSEGDLSSILAIRETNIKAETNTNCNNFAVSGVDKSEAWTHYALVFDNKSAQWYVNGSKIGPTSYGTNGCDGNNTNKLEDDVTFSVIGENTGYGKNYKGLMDEVKFSSRAMTDDEVKNLYRTQRAGFPQPSMYEPHNLASGVLGGNSLKFSSENQVSSIQQFFRPSESFAVSAWVYNTESWGEDKGTIWQSSDGRIFLRDDPRGIWGDGLVFGWYRDGEPYAITPRENLAAEKWYHVVAVYNASSADYSLYIDGVEKKGTPGIVDESSSAPAILPTTSIQQIGEGNWEGQLDELRIYDGGLSSSEVKSLGFQ